MKNGLLRAIIFGAICTLWGMLIGVLMMKQTPVNQPQTSIELGMKVSDAKWLARAGKISQEEIDEINNSCAAMSVEEYNKLLDEILEGKEEEYLAEQAELKEMIQSIRND